MGGYGSGPYGVCGKSGKRTVEGCLRIDIRELRKKDYLRPGLFYTWQWHSSRDPQDNPRYHSSVGITVYQDGIKLKYTVTPEGEKKGTDYEYKISYAWTSCHYGGKRPWFVCPNINCGRRVAVVYCPLGGKYFLCRYCWNLTYNSCQTSGKLFDQATNRVRRLRRKLGAWGDREYPERPLPERPKGMHWKTYDRLVDEIIEAEQLRHWVFISDAMAMIRRWGMENELIKAEDPV